MSENFYLIEKLINVLVPIGVCVVLPVIIVKLITRARINRDNMRKEIILAAMEKNADVDIEDMMKKMNGQKKLLKTALLNKLLLGSILTILSILVFVAMAVNMCFKGFNENMFISLSVIAVPSLAIGAAFLTNYFLGKKMLAKEMEAEEQAKLSEKS